MTTIPTGPADVSRGDGPAQGHVSSADPSAGRREVRFASGGTEYAAWHYPGTNRACVIMAAGLAVTKEPGTDRFAQRFHRAGFSVLAFDYRRLGRSGGQPRQVVRVRDQLADWQAAIDFAADLPEVDSARLAAWGFSLSGGHLFRVAAGNPRLAAVIAQSPGADGLAVTRHAGRHQTPWALLRLTGRGLTDALGGLVGRRPRLVALAARHGRGAHYTRCPGRRPGAQPARHLPRLAAGGRSPVSAAARFLPTRPSRLPGQVPADGGGLRPGPVRAARAGHRRDAPRAARRAGAPTGWTLCAVPCRT